MSLHSRSSYGCELCLLRQYPTRQKQCYVALPLQEQTTNSAQAPFPSSSGYKTTIHPVKSLANALASRHCMHMTCCSELNDTLILE